MHETALSGANFAVSARNCRKPLHWQLTILLPWATTSQTMFVYCFLCGFNAWPNISRKPKVVIGSCVNRLYLFSSQPKTWNSVAKSKYYNYMLPLLLVLLLTHTTQVASFTLLLFISGNNGLKLSWTRYNKSNVSFFSIRNEIFRIINVAVFMLGLPVIPSIILCHSFHKFNIRTWCTANWHVKSPTARNIDILEIKVFEVRIKRGEALQ